MILHLKQAKVTVMSPRTIQYSLFRAEKFIFKENRSCYEVEISFSADIISFMPSKLSYFTVMKLLLNIKLCCIRVKHIIINRINHPYIHPSFILSDQKQFHFQIPAQRVISITAKIFVRPSVRPLVSPLVLVSLSSLSSHLLLNR